MNKNLQDKSEALATERCHTLKAEVERLSRMALKNEYWQRKYRQARREYKAALIYKTFDKENPL